MKHRETYREALIVSQAIARLQQGKRLEVQSPGHVIYYMGSSRHLGQHEPYWYEHPGGRTYKEEPIQVVRAVLAHVGYKAIDRAKVYSDAARDPTQHPADPKRFPDYSSRSALEKETRDLYAEAYQLDPYHMEEVVRAIMDRDVFSWSSASVTQLKRLKAISFSTIMRSRDPRSRSLRSRDVARSPRRRPPERRPYRLAPLTEREYQTLLWLADRGYDGGLFDLAGVEEQRPNGAVVLGALTEAEASQFRENVDDDPHAFLTSSGSAGLNEKMMRLYDSII